jgi:hypothetical protein
MFTAVRSLHSGGYDKSASARMTSPVNPGFQDQ